MPRDEVLHVRLTAEELAELRAAAEQDERKVSDFVRIVVLREVRVRGVQVTVDQLARILDADR